MLRIGYTGSPGAWQGVVRDNAGVIVVRCGHTHLNRQTASTHNSAAVLCMKSQVQAALQPLVPKYAPKAHLERLDEIETAFANRLVQFYRLAMTPVLITEPQHGARR